MRQKYPETTQTEPSSKDYELADQLFVLLNQLVTSTELLVDHIVTLDFDVYDDCSGDYQEEDEHDIVLNDVGIKYSFDTMCAIVGFSKTQNLQRVDDFVYMKFIRARECCLPIHDSDLRRLAPKKAQDLNIVGFTASYPRGKVQAPSTSAPVQHLLSTSAPVRHLSTCSAPSQHLSTCPAPQHLFSTCQHFSMLGAGA